MKNFFIFILFVSFMSCNNSDISNQTYANETEKSIIDKMTCWNNSESESIMNQIIETDDKETIDKLYEKKFDSDEKANSKGREALKNDTIFINLIRNDSLLNDLKNQRNQLAIEIKSFIEKVPFFDIYIKNISKDIVEYNYHFVNEFGIYELAPINTEDFQFTDRTFYKNYSELLKEAYKIPENSKVQDEHIIELNKLLISLEKIDKKLWCVRYYFEEKEKSEKEKLDKMRSQKVDSLFQQ